MESSENDSALFSNLPTGLGNRSESASENEDRAERFPHSLRPGTNCETELNSKPERTKPASPTLRSLQAHPSIGKDCRSSGIANRAMSDPFVGAWCVRGRLVASRPMHQVGVNKQGRPNRRPCLLASVRRERPLAFVPKARLLHAMPSRRPPSRASPPA